MTHTAAGHGLGLRDTLLALVPPVCWGVAFPIAKPALAHFPPMAMMSIVYALTAVLLLSVAGRPTTPAPRLVLLALMVGAGQGAMLFTGLKALPASTAMLAVQAQTPFAVLAAWLLDGARPPAIVGVGILISLVGVAIVAGAPELPPSLWPLLLVLGSALLWAVGQALVRRLSRDPGVRLSGGIYVHAAWLMTLASLLLEQGQLTAIASAGLTEWSLLVLLAVVGFALAYTVWYQLIERLRLDQVVPFTLLTPVVTLVVAAVALGENPSAVTWLGAAVVTLGVAVIVWPRRRPTVGLRPAPAHAPGP